MTRRYKVVLGYDGTNYSGWQIQPGKTTVQGEVERALNELTSEMVRINSSGRTDRGVHAREQVIHFDLERAFPAQRLVRGLNRYLSDDIRILQAQAVADDFDSRFSAVGKEYRYFIWNAGVMPPHLRLYRAHVYRPLDVSAMREAAAVLQGRHDFAAFAANPGYEREGTVRNIPSIRVLKDGREVTIVARGEGFLFKMVRSLAGFLIRVGQGELTVSDARAILKSRTRTARVPTADACGLFLWRVFYTHMPLS